MKFSTSFRALLVILCIAAANASAENRYFASEELILSEEQALINSQLNMIELEQTIGEEKIRVQMPELDR